MNTPRSVKKRKNTAEIQALRSASARCMNPHSPVHSDAGAAVFPWPPPAARASSTVSSLVTHRQVRQTARASRSLSLSLLFPWLACFVSMLARFGDLVSLIPGKLILSCDFLLLGYICYDLMVHKPDLFIFARRRPPAHHHRRIRK